MNSELWSMNTTDQLNGALSALWNAFTREGFNSAARTVEKLQNGESVTPADLLSLSRGVQSIKAQGDQSDE